MVSFWPAVALNDVQLVPLGVRVVPLVSCNARVPAAVVTTVAAVLHTLLSGVGCSFFSKQPVSKVLAPRLSTVRVANVRPRTARFFIKRGWLGVEKVKLFRKSAFG